jgi:hypothetical protein
LQEYVPLAVNALSIESRKAAVETTSTSVHDKREEVARSPERQEPNSEEADMAKIDTTFDQVNAPTIEVGAKTATVSGTLLQKEGSIPVGGVEVIGSLKTSFLKSPLSASATTNDSGKFEMSFDTSALPVGSHKHEIKYLGTPEKELDGATYKGTIVVKEASTSTEVPQDKTVAEAPSSAGQAGEPADSPSDRDLEGLFLPAWTAPAASSDCVPCTDLISTVKRVLRDPGVNKHVSEYLRGRADNNSTTQSQALNDLADAVAGCDAIQATGPSCTTAIQLEIFIWDALNQKLRQLEREELEAVTVRLLENGTLAANAPSFEGKKMIFRSASAGAGTFSSGLQPQLTQNKPNTNYPQTVSLLFSAEFAAQSGIAPIFKGTEPGGATFNFYSTAPPKQPVDSDGTAGNAEQNQSTNDVSRKTISQTESTPQFERNGSQSGAQSALKQALAAWGLEEKKYKEVEPVGAFALRYRGGVMTQAQCLIIPQLSQVRCLSVVEGDPCCLQGAWVEEECQCGKGCSTAECRCEKSRQYISGVSICAFHEGIPAGCHQTGKSGCSGFELAPGWYQFTAPEEVQIYGCNYSLCTPSPISAFVGARQSCSDIFFTYKKKGAMIEVISEIVYPDPTNPYVEARNNLAGMSYLLVREGDSSFAPQQQTTIDGGALRFENVPVGTYLLFCQGPATYDSLPVEPFRPENGRMALRVFGGQTHSKIPVLVKFRQSRTTPAVLNGYVRDDTGQPIPSQVVQVLDQAGRVIAAGLTDTNGVYSIQIYKAENVTLAFGSQQFAVPKAQIQAAMTTGPARLPSPMLAMETAVESAEILGAGR